MGVVFGYTKLFPPPFWTAYLKVDQATGDWDDKKSDEISVPREQWTAVFFAIHNTGVAPWNNYRITIHFEEGFAIQSDIGEIPPSTGWGWKTRDLRIIRERSQAQIQADNTLAVGEPQTMRFVLKSASRTGKSKVRVSVVCDGRLSESNRELWLNVV